MPLPGPFPLASAEVSAVSRAVRFAAGVNFLRPEDFGAVGNGTTDDTLALQRCLCFSAGLPNVMDYDFEDTHQQFVGAGVLITVPKLYGGYQQQIDIRLSCNKTYRTTRPLHIGIGCNITGEGQAGLCRIFPDGDFNCIESFHVWTSRNFPAEKATAVAPFGGYQDAVTLRNFTIHRPFRDGPVGYFSSAQHQVHLASIPTPPQTTYQEYLAERLAFYNYPEVYGQFLRASGGATGTSSVLLSGPFDAALMCGEFIRFSGGAEIYQVASFQGATLTVVGTFTRSIQSAEYLLLGTPAQNGIMIEGGENSLIDQVYVNNMDGAGIFVNGGSPGPMIRNCMVNQCYIGYWIEAGPVAMEKISGDGNHIAMRAGTRRSSVVLVNGFKFEDPAGLGRCIFQIGSINSGAGSAYVFNCGNAAPNSTNGYLSPTAQDKSPIEIWRFATVPSLDVRGMHDQGWGGSFLREYEHGTGVLISKVGRNGPVGSGSSYSSSSNCARFGRTYMEDGLADHPYQQIFDTTEDATYTGGVGILGDQGSGVMTGDVTFVRAATTTTATFTRAAHGLKVGDYIRPTNYSALTGSGALGFTISGAGTTAFWNGNLRVMTVPDADHFTCTVTDTGPTAGTVRLVATKVFRLHDVRLNEHRFQMPRVTGYSYSSGSAFGWFDKQMRRLMALLVPSENTGTLWVKSGIAIGGTVSDVNTATPDVTITGGVAAPSSSAPDGSLYLRTNGTLWQRRAGAWAQLAA